MTDLRKAAEMALDFVDWLCGDDHSVKPKNNALKTREALRQALDKPEIDQQVLVQMAVLAEREACANLCDEWGQAAGMYLAATIRARGEK